MSLGDKGTMKRLIWNLFGLALIALVLAGLAVKAEAMDSFASQIVMNAEVEVEGE